MYDKMHVVVFKLVKSQKLRAAKTNDYTVINDIPILNEPMTHC